MLPRKVEVADPAIHHWPVEWHAQLASTVGRRRSDVEIDAECRERLHHVPRGEARAAVNRGQAWDDVQDFHTAHACSRMSVSRRSKCSNRKVL